MAVTNAEIKALKHFRHGFWTVLESGYPENYLIMNLIRAGLLESTPLPWGIKYKITQLGRVALKGRHHVKSNKPS